MWRRLAARSTEPEQLDNCDFWSFELDHALRDLERFNRWLGGNRSLVRALRRALPFCPQRPLTVVDIGCGSGDGLRVLARWGSRQAIPLRLFGVDANPAVIDIARRASRDEPTISYVVGDAFGTTLERLNPDVVVANQFFHHFTQAELEARLPQLLRRTRVLVISDLHRSALAHAGFGIISRLLNASTLARHDGLVSIRRGFTRAEWQGLLARLPLRHQTIDWSFFRHELLLAPLNPRASSQVHDVQTGVMPL